MNVIIAFCAKYLVVVGPVLVALVWLRLANRDRRSLFLRTVTVGALCAGFAYVAGQAYNEQRPFVKLHVEPLVSAAAAGNAFPSYFTAYAAACCFLLFPYAKIPSILAGINASLVAWAQVASLLHSLTDVIAAVVLALVASLIGKILVRRLPNDRNRIPNIGRAPRPTRTR